MDRSVAFLAPAGARRTMERASGCRCGCCCWCIAVCLAASGAAAIGAVARAACSYANWQADHGLRLAPAARSATRLAAPALVRRQCPAPARWECPAPRAGVPGSGAVGAPGSGAGQASPAPCDMELLSVSGTGARIRACWCRRAGHPGERVVAVAHLAGPRPPCRARGTAGAGGWRSSVVDDRGEQPMPFVFGPDDLKGPHQRAQPGAWLGLDAGRHDRAAGAGSPSRVTPPPAGTVLVLLGSCGIRRDTGRPCGRGFRASQLAESGGAQVGGGTWQGT